MVQLQDHVMEVMRMRPTDLAKMHFTGAESEADEAANKLFESDPSGFELNMAKSQRSAAAGLSGFVTALRQTYVLLQEVNDKLDRQEASAKLDRLQRARQ
jgi:hypothetical protein